MDGLALYGSSFFRIPFTAQSNVLNRPPQTPKLPPRTGARALMAVSMPSRRSPWGLLRKPGIVSFVPKVALGCREGVRGGERRTFHAVP